MRWLRLGDLQGSRFHNGRADFLGASRRIGVAFPGRQRPRGSRCRQAVASVQAGGAPWMAPLHESLLAAAMAASVIWHEASAPARLD
jgi:hypothetical protein